MTAATLPDDTMARDDGLRTAWRRALVTLGILVAAVIALSLPVVESLVNVWWNTATYNHCFLIIPIVGFLVWLRKERVATLRPRAEPLALVLVIGASVLLMLGELADVNIVQHFALVGLIVSLAIFTLGREVVWELKFPLFFLFFLVPVGDQAVPFLQDITAVFAVWLLRAIDIPIFHDGIMIETPTGLFEVAEACAGIRFLIANVVIAVLFAHLAYDRWWKMAAFIGLGLLIPILANGIRAFGIIYIAYMTDNEYAVGVDHIVYGWGFFAAIMLILLFIGNMFADRRPGDLPNAPAWRMASAPRAVTPLLAGVAALAALVAPAFASYKLNRDFSGHTTPALTAISSPAPGWTMTANPDIAWSPEFESADANYLFRFEKEGAAPVDLFIAWYTHQRHGAKVVYFANTFEQHPRWIRLETRGARVDTGASGLPASVRTDRIGGIRPPQRLVASWYWVDGRFSSGALDAKLDQLRANLTGGEDAAAVIALSASLEFEREEALSAIEAFLAEAQPLDAWLGALAATARPSGAN